MLAYGPAGGPITSCTAALPEVHLVAHVSAVSSLKPGLSPDRESPCAPLTLPLAGPFPRLLFRVTRSSPSRAAPPQAQPAGWGWVCGRQPCTPRLSESSASLPGLLSWGHKPLLCTVPSLCLRDQEALWGAHGFCTIFLRMETLGYMHFIVFFLNRLFAGISLLIPNPIGCPLLQTGKAHPCFTLVPLQN